MQGMVQAKAASQLVSGSKLPSLVSGVCNATSQYVLASAIVNSTNIAMGPGSGTQIGHIVGLVPSLMSTLMLSKAASMGIAGRDLNKLFGAISFGVCNSMQTVVMQGTIIGAGPGTGTGKILGLVPNVLAGLILAQEAFKTIAGSKINSLVSAIAFGICTHILTTAIVTITDIGVASPPPAGPVPVPAAPGIGRLV